MNPLFPARVVILGASAWRSQVDLEATGHPGSLPGVSHTLVKLSLLYVGRHLLGHVDLDLVNPFAALRPGRGYGEPRPVLFTA